MEIDILYTTRFAESFIQQKRERLQQFESVFTEMKHDYQDLFDHLDSRVDMGQYGTECLIEGCDSDTPVRVKYVEMIRDVDSYDGALEAIWADIKKTKERQRRYDGTDEAFREVTGIQP